MKQIKIIRPTVAAKLAREVGDVLTVEDAEARELVAMEKAIPVVTGGGGSVDEKLAVTTDTAAPLVRKTRAVGPSEKIGR